MTTGMDAGQTPVVRAAATKALGNGVKFIRANMDMVCVVMATVVIATGEGSRCHHEGSIQRHTR